MFVSPCARCLVFNSKTLVVLCYCYYQNIWFQKVRFTMWEESEIQVINFKMFLLLCYCAKFRVPRSSFQNVEGETDSGN